MEEDLVEQCAIYFKSNEGFKRIFEKIKEKYKSLGSLGGTIVLKNLSDMEKEALTGYFGKDYYKKSTSIKVSKFAEALNNTKFCDIDFKEVLDKYFGEELISKKEEKSIYEMARDSYYNTLITNIEGEKPKMWFLHVLQNKDNTYRFINQKYDENKEILKRNLEAVFKALNLISLKKNNVIRLALLASTTTRDPHFFDFDRDAGKLLIFAVVFFMKVSYPKNAEELSEIMYSAGVIKDEVSNYTLCSSILACLRNGEFHKGISGFFNAGEPIQLSLINLSQLDKIFSPQGKVYVFENPTVFTEVFYRTQEYKPSLICTFGNFKLASLILLDKIFESEAKIYYSGDLDPEGIVMADKLKQRYKEKLILWKYDAKTYLNIISKVKITETRMKKLRNIKSQELNTICKMLENTKYAAYQEMLVEEYIKDIENLKFE